MSSSDHKKDDNQDKKDGSEGLSRVLKAGRRLFGGEKETRGGPDRRSGKRVRLPVRVRVGTADGKTWPAQVHEVNLPGLSLEPAGEARVGEAVTIDFDGYPGVSPPFAIHGQVVRTGIESVDRMAISVDRKVTSPEALQSYRALVRHYLHHKPLLEDVNKGYFEGRCTSCDWVGRVGRGNPRCSSCGSKVVPI